MQLLFVLSSSALARLKSVMSLFFSHGYFRSLMDVLWQFFVSAFYISSAFTALLCSPSGPQVYSHFFIIRQKNVLTIIFDQETRSFSLPSSKLKKTPIFISVPCEPLDNLYVYEVWHYSNESDYIVAIVVILLNAFFSFPFKNICHRSSVLMCRVE